MNINIQVASHQDFLEINDLYQTFRYDPWVLSKQVFTEAVDMKLCLKATDHNTIIGFSYAAKFAPDIYELQNLFVAKEFRKHGIGSKLLLQLEENAKEISCKGVILETSELYKTIESKGLVKNFYKKLGYELIAQTDNTQIMFKNI